MKKKWIRIGLTVTGVLLVVAIAGGLYLNWMMKQPLYQFGDVSKGRNLRGSLTPPQQQTASTWFVEPDIQLHFDAYGQGQPVLVVHGGPGIPYPEAWKGLSTLTDKYKFYYYHQRGCGDSTRPFSTFENGNYYENMVTLEKTLGLGAQIADIERIRQILGQERLTIIGHSFGGFIATLYAAEFPDRVDKLVLVAPAGVLTPPDEDRNLFDLARNKLPDDTRKEYDKLVNQYFDFGSIFSKSDSELADLHMKTGRYLLEAMGYHAIDFKSGPSSGGWSVFALYFSCGRAQDYRPALLQVGAPTLIITGQDDEISIAGSRSYQSIEGSRFELIGRENENSPAGHFIYDENPARFGEIVIAFLSGD